MRIAAVTKANPPEGRLFRGVLVGYVRLTRPQAGAAVTERINVRIVSTSATSFLAEGAAVHAL